MKNNKYVLSGSLLVLGFFAGWLVFGTTKTTEHIDTHSMNEWEVSGDMHGAMDDMVGGLTGKTGEAFDKAFLEEMIVHHEGAVEMANEALKNAKHQELKNMANEIISAQTKEIAQMKDWKNTWFKN